MLKKTSRLLFRSTMAGVVVLALACAYLVIREQRTLAILLMGGGPQGTEVYARWLTLRPAQRVTPEAVLSELHALDYKESPRPPSQPGEFQVTPRTFTIYTRGFRYPDQDYPAQVIQLEFSSKGLETVQYATGSKVSEWRLEPVRLARWTAEPANRIPVRLSELPSYVPQAVVAIEDKRFFHHGAIDPVGVGRALFVDLRRGRLRQGASTISQQLARSVFLDVNRTWRRKVLEAGLAFYLEARYSKVQLLEMYLNQVYWGQDGPENLLGIESASRAYFGKSARQLTVAEAALLAGMLHSPNRLSPRSDFKAAIAREKVVLSLMHDQEFLTEPQYQAALAEAIHVPPSNRQANASAYFLATLHDELSDRYSLPVLLNQGWRIFTTLDPALEKTAQAAIASLDRVPAKAGQEREEAALVALDPADGAIRAWVGGTSFQKSPFDRAINARRQPGSAFKPFVALAALESRRATTVTRLDDKPLVVSNDGKPWAPQNYDRKFRGTVSLWDALVFSLNVPMVRLAMATGLPLVAEVAHRAGIESVLKDVPSLALGTSEVSVVELTAGYATLANGGSRVIPYDVQAIVAPDRSVIELHQAKPEHAFGPDVTFLVTQMLQAVLQSGTAQAARAMGFTFPAAGKTGTSENYQDAWFVGYSPDLVAGVWVGYDHPRSLGRSAAGIALPVWVRFMQSALKRFPSFEFAAPNDLVWKTIDLESGLLVRTGCVQRRDVAFLPGTEPTQYCPLHPGGIVGFFKRLRGRFDAKPAPGAH